ncbi:MAG: hypothetical protein NC211_03055 [Alistipes senegalensis]|nr:hypothetical protein [Alistipes senegalensis]
MVWRVAAKKKSDDRPYIIDIILFILVKIGNMARKKQRDILAEEYLRHLAENDELDLNIINDDKGGRDRTLMVIFLIVGLVLIIVVGGLFFVKMNQIGEGKKIFEAKINEEQKVQDNDKETMVSAKRMGKIISDGIVYTVANHASLSNEILKRHYGRYHSGYHCYLKEMDADDRFCMGLERIDYIDSQEGSYVYILARETYFWEDGPIKGCHFCGGMVGVFVAKYIGNSQYKIVAKNPELLVGYWGRPPEKWNFLKFGTDLWGYQSEAGSMTQGHNWMEYVLLIPRNGVVRDSYILYHYDYENLDGRKVNLNASLVLDPSKQSGSIYSIISTVSGVYNGQLLHNRLFRISFDEKLGKYKVPAEYKGLFGDI